MDDIINSLAALFGAEPATIAALIPLFILACNVIARLIPDDATGWLGFANKLFKFLGAQVSNRVASGVTVNDVVAVVAKADVPARESDGKFSSVGAILDKIDSLHAIKKRQREEGFITGFFLTFKPVLALGALCALMILLAGCTTIQAAKEITCSNRQTIRDAAELTLKAVDKLDQVCPIPLLPPQEN